MDKAPQVNLEEKFDWILNQLEKGNSITGLKNNIFYGQFEQVKEWKSKYGYQLQIYSDHPIEGKPHFHLINRSENIECRIFFDNTIYDCKGRGRLSKKVQDALEYFLGNAKHQEILLQRWKSKNPTL